MKINLATTFTTLSGGAINDESGARITLRTIIVNSLSLTRCGMPPAKAWELAKRVYSNSGDSIDIPTEDVVHVKEAISNHALYPMLIAQAHAAIEAGVSE